MISQQFLLFSENLKQETTCLRNKHKDEHFQGK